MHAREILFSGRMLTGTEAAALGLALRSVPRAELDDAVARADRAAREQIAARACDAEAPDQRQPRSRHAERDRARAQRDHQARQRPPLRRDRGTERGAGGPPALLGLNARVRRSGARGHGGPSSLSVRRSRCTTPDRRIRPARISTASSGTRRRGSTRVSASSCASGRSQRSSRSGRRLPAGSRAHHVVDPSRLTPPARNGVTVVGRSVPTAAAAGGDGAVRVCGEHGGERCDDGVDRPAQRALSSGLEATSSVERARSRRPQAAQVVVEAPRVRSMAATCPSAAAA